MGDCALTETPPQCMEPAWAKAYVEVSPTNEELRQKCQTACDEIVAAFNQYQITVEHGHTMTQRSPEQGGVGSAPLVGDSVR